VRPLVGRELKEGDQRTCVEVDQYSNKIQLGEKNFQFDRVFPLDCYQEDIFDTCAKNLVLGCFAGFNATILAYGQTGSGKTHTMGTGSTAGLAAEHIGMLPRVFQFIFKELDARKKVSQFSEFAIKVSFLELYNEELHDLLDPASMVLDRITGKP
jgi:kinesin family protein 4/21/27